MKKDEIRQNGGGLIDVLSYTAETVKTLADSNSVVGERIEKDGVTVIPISKLSVGFAGGGADIRNAKKGKYQSPAGAGAKVTRTPVTLLVIDSDGAHIIDVSEPKKPSKIAETVSVVAEQVKSMMASKEKEEQNETD